MRSGSTILRRVDDLSEIEETVGEALGALGVSGAIVVAGSSIELRSGGAPIAIDIDLVLRQWPLLPAEMKRRKAGEIAKRLAEAHEAAIAEGRAVRARRPVAPMRFWLAVIAGIAALALVGVVRMIIPRLRTENVAPKTPSEPDDARRQRLARACDAMRDRLYKGASFGPFATEGWVVELWLARAKGGTMKDNTALLGAIAGGKVTAATDDQLAEVKDGTVEITDGFSEEMGNRSPAWGGAVLVFREGYARAFLEEHMRPRFVTMAEKLAEASGAEAGALYARCAHVATHDIGAWFHGADSATAVAAMVYQMGFFAEGSVLDRGAIGALRAPGGDLDALRKAAGGPDGDVLPRIVTAQGGSVSTARGTSLVFPLSAPMRSIAATRAAAGKMRVGVRAD